MLSDLLRGFRLRISFMFGGNDATRRQGTHGEDRRSLREILAEYGRVQTEEDEKEILKGDNPKSRQSGKR